MANYFVIENKFKPYSFDELIKPYQIYGEAYKEQEALIDAARDKEFSVDNLNKDIDTAAYNMYDKASKDLKAVSDELATKGLSADLRGRLRSAAKDYGRTMNSLTEAQKKLDAERARRANLGTDYVFRKKDIRIGDFLNGGIPDQEAVKLSNVTKHINDRFSNIAKNLSQSTWDKVLSKNGRVINGYFDVTTKTGLEEAQLNSILAMANDESWNRYVMSDRTMSTEEKKQLQNFVDAIKDEMNAVDFANYDDDSKREIWGAIVDGAHAGLGTTTHSYQRDVDYTPYDPYKAAARQTAAAEIALKRQEFMAKHPQFVYNEDGSVRMNNGKPVIADGWSQDGSGNWYDSQGNAAPSNTKTNKSNNQKGVKVFNEDGEITGDFASVDKAVKKNTGESVFKGAEVVYAGETTDKDGKKVRTLSDNNLRIIANELGISLANPDRVDDAEVTRIFTELRRKGISIRVMDTSRARDGRIKKQKMGIIYGETRGTTPSGTSETVVTTTTPAGTFPASDVSNSLPAGL